MLQGGLLIKFLKGKNRVCPVILQEWWCRCAAGETGDGEDGAVLAIASRACCIASYGKGRKGAKSCPRVEMWVAAARGLPIMKYLLSITARSGYKRNNSACQWGQAPCRGFPHPPHMGRREGAHRLPRGVPGIFTAEVIRLPSCRGL